MEDRIVTHRLWSITESNDDVRREMVLAVMQDEGIQLHLHTKYPDREDPVITHLLLSKQGLDQLKYMIYSVQKDPDKFKIPNDEEGQTMATRMTIRFDWGKEVTM